jgi:hypothetical protein
MSEVNDLVFPYASSFPGASAGFLARAKGSEVHLDEGKHEKRRAIFATCSILQPLHFHPFSIC